MISAGMYRKIYGRTYRKGIPELSETAGKRDSFAEIKIMI